MLSVNDQFPFGWPKCRKDDTRNDAAYAVTFNGSCVSEIARPIDHTGPNSVGRRPAPIGRPNRRKADSGNAAVGAFYLHGDQGFRNRTPDRSARPKCRRPTARSCWAADAFYPPGIGRGECVAAGFRNRTIDRSRLAKCRRLIRTTRRPMRFAYQRAGFSEIAPPIEPAESNAGGRWPHLLGSRNVERQVRATRRMVRFTYHGSAFFRNRALTDPADPNAGGRRPAPTGWQKLRMGDSDSAAVGAFSPPVIRGLRPTHTHHPPTPTTTTPR